MKHSYQMIYENIKIRELRETDIEMLRIWRNDSELSNFLRPMQRITSEMQKMWFEDYLLERDYYFFCIEEILELNRMVGALALYEFRGEQASIGKIVVGDEAAHGRNIAFTAMLLTMKIGFERLGVKKFNLNVHENNIPAKKVYEKIGFTVTGKHPFISGGYELEMTIGYRELFEKHPNII